MFISSGLNNNNGFPLIQLNVDTGQSTLIGRTQNAYTDIAFHTSERLIGSTGTLSWIDPTTAQETLLGTPFYLGEPATVGNSMVAAADGSIYFNHIRIIGGVGSTLILKWFPDRPNEEANLIATLPNIAGLGDLLFSDAKLFFAVMANGGGDLLEIDLLTGSYRRVGALPFGTFGIGNRADSRAYAAVGPNVLDLNLADATTSNPRLILMNEAVEAWGMAMRDEGCGSLPVN